MVRGKSGNFMLKILNEPCSVIDNPENESNKNDNRRLLGGVYESHAMSSYRLGSLSLCASSMCDVNCSTAVTSQCLLIHCNKD